MPPSTWITREQAVRAECGICTSHKRTYFLKSIHKRHLQRPKIEPKYLPKATPETTWGPKITRTVPKPEKNQFWAAGSRLKHAKRDPNWLPKRHPKSLKWRLHIMSQETYMLGTIWNLQNELLGPKIEVFGTHVGDFGPSEANLRFLKDVLYGLHVFAIQDVSSSLHKTL